MSLFRIVTYAKFDPSNLNSLKLWLDASTLTGADNSPISTWSDASGNGADFIQSVSAYQPTLQVTEQNNRNVVRFDGVDDFMFNSTVTDVLKNKTAGTVFVVVKYSATAKTNPAITISDGLNTWFSRARLFQSSSLVYGSTGKRLDSATEEATPSTSTVVNQFVVHQAEYNYGLATMTQSINGTVDGVDSSFGTAGSTSNTNSVALTIGSKYQSPSTVLYPSSTLIPYAGIFMSGDIAEICVFDRALTASESNYMLQYFNSKWNL